jgi:hypothetical protein
VTHEKEIAEQEESDEDDGKAEQRFLEEAKGAVKSLRLFHSASV